MPTEKSLAWQCNVIYHCFDDDDDGVKKVHRNQGRLRVDLLILMKTKLQSLVYTVQTASLEQKKS